MSEPYRRTLPHSARPVGEEQRKQAQLPALFFTFALASQGISKKNNNNYSNPPRALYRSLSLSPLFLGPDSLGEQLFARYRSSPTNQPTMITTIYHHRHCAARQIRPGTTTRLFQYQICSSKVYNWLSNNPQPASKSYLIPGGGQQISFSRWQI